MSKVRFPFTVPFWWQVRVEKTQFDQIARETASHIDQGKIATVQSTLDQLGVAPLHQKLAIKDLSSHASNLGILISADKVERFTQAFGNTWNGENVSGFLFYAHLRLPPLFLLYQFLLPSIGPAFVGCLLGLELLRGSFHQKVIIANLQKLESLRQKSEKIKEKLNPLLEIHQTDNVSILQSTLNDFDRIIREMEKRIWIVQKNEIGIRKHALAPGSVGRDGMNAGLRLFSFGFLNHPVNALVDSEICNAAESQSTQYIDLVRSLMRFRNKISLMCRRGPFR